MPFLAIVALGFAIGWWIGNMRKRKAARRRTADEIRATLETGLPSNETALGRRTAEIREAQERKLQSPPPVHGSARWATEADVTSLLDGNRLATVNGSRGLTLGRMMRPDDTDTDIPLVVRYPGHLLTVAGTGQGKAVTQIVANLLSYSGSVVVIDPKGELYDLTHERRREFGDVYRIAPFAAAGERSDHYNPLDELNRPDELGKRARRLAEMLFVRQAEKGAADAGYFENEAVNLLTAIIMFVVEQAENQKRPGLNTLSEVRSLCTLPLLGGRTQRAPKVTYLEDVLLMMGDKGKDPYVKRQGRFMASIEPKQLSAFTSEINSNLAFFDGHPGFARVTAKSDFLFEQLADKTTTVYLTVPLGEMDTSFRFLRALIGQAFASLKEQRDATEASVLFILDEFAALRDMPFMRSAVAQMRSTGAWFWFFVQDVAQLDGVYQDWSNVFLSQTDHQIYFGATVDPRTKSHISTNLGVMTMAYRDPNVSWNHSVGLNDNESGSPTQMGGFGEGRNVGQSINVAEPIALSPRALLTPFEVGTYLSQRRDGETHPSTTIIFSKQANGYPVKARRRHWKDEVFVRQTAAKTIQPIARATRAP